MSKEFIKRILSSIILIPLSFYLIIEGSFLFNFFLLICFLLTSFEWFKMSKNKIYNIFGYIFITFSFYCAYNLRNKFNDESLIIFLLIIITCISTDIGGYIFGKIFKGPRLTSISPKKTYSGMLGGYLLSIITVYIFLNNLYLSSDYFVRFTYKSLIVVLAISTVSQIGDIIVSYFKRLSKIKDTGKIIPGHGGILDRIDGVIFALPFSYIIFSTILIK